jgi:hypothetical protein
MRKSFGRRRFETSPLTLSSEAVEGNSGPIQLPPTGEESAAQPLLIQSFIIANKKALNIEGKIESF